MLTRSPETLSVGEIIRYVEGPLSPVKCNAGATEEQCPLYGNCAFLPMWKRANEALSEVYDTTTFEDMVEEERMRQTGYVPDYCI